jgi:enolase
MKAKSISIREILATNVQKTIEVELETSKGTVRSSVPIGTSKGKYEVMSLPTEDVIRKFLLIRRHFITQEFSNQEEVDGLLRIIDKTPNFKEIGGNLALGISSAFLKAFAMEENLETFEYLLKDKPFMPRPISNVIGGWAGTGSSDIQEFLLMPLHQKSFLDSATKMAKAYWEIGKMLKEKDQAFVFSKNLESGWVTTLDIENTMEILDGVAKENLLMIGLDMAASNIWDGTFYVYKNSGVRYSRTEQINFVEHLANKYSVHYIEDPFDQDDYLGFSVLTHRLPKKLICGDDLFTTNMERLKKGIEQKAANSMIIKPNQVGTITDVIKVVAEAKRNNMSTIVSHRSGETEDTVICHLAVGLNCDFIKLGIGGERTSKVNEMIRIEEWMSNA